MTADLTNIVDMWDELDEDERRALAFTAQTIWRWKQEREASPRPTSHPAN